jgi:hypothetical protein
MSATAATPSTISNAANEISAITTYSNSPELIAHYTKVFKDAGIKNFRFVLTE